MKGKQVLRDFSPEGRKAILDGEMELRKIGTAHNEWPDCPHPNPCPRKSMNGKCDPFPRKVSVCPIYNLDRTPTYCPTCRIYVPANQPCKAVIK